MKNVAILDLGVGNLHSLEKSFARLEGVARVTITPEVATALRQDVVVLPGVGAFSGAASRLQGSRDVLRESLLAGKPCIGICLGMQLLFDRSEEGEGEGIGLLRGTVRRLSTKRIPHMGWSRIDPTDTWPGWRVPTALYFAHSFACDLGTPESTLATTAIEGDRFATVVRHARTIGFQFHPEKSSTAGNALLGEALREVTR